MSKTRTGLPAPPFSARRRRRRLSSRPGFPCQSALSSFFLAAGEPGFEERSATAEAGSERKNHCGLPRGFPHRSVAIRLKDRKLYADDDKIKGFLSRLPSSPRRSRPESGVFMGRRSPCQSTFRTFFAVAANPKVFDQCEGPRRRSGAEGIGLSMTAGYLADPAAGARANRQAFVI